jgi:hypothetical protein
MPAGPYFFGIEGWKLVAGHFAERHGLILIVALGESIVAIGAGAEGEVDAGIVVRRGARHGGRRPRCGGCTSTSVALVAERRLAAAAPGREQNAMARDSYSVPALPDGRPGSCSSPSG